MKRIITPHAPGAVDRLKQLKVIPTPETPVEILSNCIAHISRSVRDMRAGRLTDKAIITLVHDDTGIPKRTISAVITSLEYLERTYLKEKNT